VLARHGGKRVKIIDDDLDDSSSPKMNLADLGINPNIAAAGVKLTTPSKAKTRRRSRP
jgi:hypothetical protein